MCLTPVDWSSHTVPTIPTAVSYDDDPHIEKSQLVWGMIRRACKVDPEARYHYATLYAATDRAECLTTARSKLLNLGTAVFITGVGGQRVRPNTALAGCPEDALTLVDTLDQIRLPRKVKAPHLIIPVQAFEHVT